MSPHELNNNHTLKEKHMSKISNAIKWIWCVEKPVQANSKVEWLARATFLGSLRPTEHPADLGRLVFWYGVGLTVIYKKYEYNRLEQQRPSFTDADFRQAGLDHFNRNGIDPTPFDQDFNTESVNDVQDISTPLITKTEFVERPGLFGNIDPDITRFTLVYDTDELDESGVLAQVSRIEFEHLREMTFVGNTVQKAKERVIAALVYAERTRQAQF